MCAHKRTYGLSGPPAVAPGMLSHQPLRLLDPSWASSCTFGVTARLLAHKQAMHQSCKRAFQYLTVILLGAGDRQCA